MPGMANSIKSHICFLEHQNLLGLCPWIPLGTSIPGPLVPLCKS